VLDLRQKAASPKLDLAKGWHCGRNHDSEARFQ
jgi:hypothetical protein